MVADSNMWMQNHLDKTKVAFGGSKTACDTDIYTDSQAQAFSFFLPT